MTVAVVKELTDTARLVAANLGSGTLHDTRHCATQVTSCRGILERRAIKSRSKIESFE